jgi:hypothetical protein
METVFVANRAKAKRLFTPAKTGKLVPCTGEAHTNGFQDHCGVCMPRWGEVEEREVVTLAILQKAWESGQIVAWSQVPHDLHDVVDALRKDGSLREITVHIGRSASNWYQSFSGLVKGSGEISLATKK